MRLDGRMRPSPRPDHLRRVSAALLLAAAVGLFAAQASTVAAATRPASVLATEATGPVTPVMADHLADAVRAAESGGHQALLVRLDTPGGLVTAMRDIVKSLLNAPVPVVVWVAPSGAGAASAGYVITTAAHVAAMAPGTNIGAATPVNLQEGGEVSDKVVNDAVSYVRSIAELRGRNAEFAEEATREGASLAAREAVDREVVDLLATTREQLLEGVDGRSVEVAGGRRVELSTAAAAVEGYDASWTRRLLQRIADPNLAFLFMSIGTLAILYELANPGIGAGAVVGVILIVLALFSMAVLPVNLAGVALLVLAMALFVAEVFAPGIGVLATGGTVALLLAGLFLFHRPTGIGIDLAVLLPTVALAGLSAAGLAVVAARTRRAGPASGAEALVGEAAEVRKADGDTGQVFVGGALWKARSVDGDLQPGATVRVVERRDLELLVEPVPPQEGAP
jgi:membrane-bound serine protease (ClpP class)